MTVTALCFVLTAGGGCKVADDACHDNDPGCDLLALLSYVYFEDVFVAVGARSGNAVILRSPDGRSWTDTGFSAPGVPLVDVAFGNNTFVAIAGGGAISQAYYSTNGGLEWRTGNAYAAATLNSIAYGNGVFIAVGTAGAVRYSTDGGINWSSSSIPAGFNAQGLASNGQGTFIAAATGAIGSARSVDGGATWTTQGAPVSALNDLTYGATQGGTEFFGVALGSIGSYTTDATTWNGNNTGAVSGTRAVAIGNNAVVAAGNLGEIRYERNHTNPAWPNGATAGSQNLFDIVFGVGRFVAVGAGDSVHYSITDGATWSPATGVTGSSTLQGVDFGRVLR